MRIEPALSFEALTDKALKPHAADAAHAEINASKAVIFAEEALRDDPQVPSERKVEED